MKSNSITPSAYRLMNVATERLFDDGGWTLSDPQYDKPSLIRTIYSKKQIDVKEDSFGFYKFADWLPISRILEGSSPTITYKSEKLASHLGLDQLYIAFSGYWPEKGAFMKTCSFKETEAYSVCARLRSDDKRILTVASAGNTARAFAKVCSDNNIPLLLCVPEDNIDALWFEKPLNECVKLICSPKGSDYFDAISLSNSVCKSELFLNEGGAKNVARRDGMATTVLSASTFIGRIPDSYFQAIGSGTGTIAAWESNLRLIDDGRFGSHKMRLFPSQNAPFAPMYDAWKADSRELLPVDDEILRSRSLQIKAKVLSNRKPPYSIAGGLFDAIKDAGGDIELATNGDIEEKSEMFKVLEGIDIHPAAAVAVTGLINALKSGKIDHKETIMINITGGGEKRFKSDNTITYLTPHLILNPSESADAIIKKVSTLY